MVDSLMFGPIRDKTVITAEFVNVDKTLPFHLPDGHFKECFTLNIAHDLHGYIPLSFQNAEYRDLVRRPTSAFSLPSPFKVRLIPFNPSENEDIFASVVNIAILMREWILETVL